MFGALEGWIIRYLLHWYTQRDFKATVTLHHAYIAFISCCRTFAGCMKNLQWGVGILAGIWALASSSARTQLSWGSESYQASACYVFAMCSGLHRSLDLWWEKLSPPLRLQSTLVMCFLIFLGTCHLRWWASPLVTLCWAPFLHQEQDIGNASALSCSLHLPCECYCFWSFLLGVKFRRGFWEVLCCLWWTGACRKNVWEPGKYI